MKKKILVVDDSISLRRVLAKELEHPSFEIYEADNGQSALNMIPEIQPDLITLDVDMPGLNGYDTCKIIRSQPQAFEQRVDGKNIPIVFVTANDSIEQRNKGFEAGCSDFITKPFVRGELLSVVNNILFPEARLSGLTAIIADDSPTILSALTGLLRPKGLNLITAVNGKEVVDYVRENRDIDVIIMDFIMPEMDGAEACRIIRHELGLRDIPIIIVSSIEDKNALLDFFKAGITDYIVKPFAKEELFARLDAHIKTGLLHRKLNSRVAELKTLNKLKDEFLAIASHDLRSPLNGILGFADLLLEDNSIQGTHREYLGHIYTSGNYLLNLINDILDISKLETENENLEFDSILLVDLCKECLEMLSHMASPKQQKLSINVSPGDNPIIQGNENALKRVINNFLSNAIKFTPPKGSISINIKAFKGQVQIDIKDSGIGIAPDKIPMLFEKYSKTSQPGTEGEKGTGLGMAINKELVERHGGTILVTSKLEKGTTFSIIFPMTKNYSGNRKTTPVSTKKHPDELQVLLVDDNVINLNLGHSVLKKLGIKADTMDKAADLLTRFQQIAESNADIPWNVIFLDMNMPGIDGTEAAITIRDIEQRYQLPETPLIAMTNNSSDSILAQEAGINEMLMKPLDSESLKIILEQYRYGIS